MTDDLLPPGVARMWRPAARPARKEGLSVARVVEAGIALADEDGFDAVSMARVAQRLGFTTMSLYRHVTSKDELLVLMVDGAVGTPPALDASAGWREQLDAWSRALLAVVRAHPWVLRIPLGWPAMGPNRAGWMDRGLAAMAHTPLTEDDKASVTLLLNNVVMSTARFQHDMDTSVVDRTPAEGEFAAMLTLMVDGDRFPALRRAIDAGVFDGDGAHPDDDVDFDLARVLDGIERLVEARARA